MIKSVRLVSRIAALAMLTGLVAMMGCSLETPTAPIPTSGPYVESGDKIARSNLRVENISHTATRAADGKYNVVFYVTVANRGTATSGSFVVGGKGWGTATISTCTGLWRAISTTSGLSVGATRTVVIYGPGYVGPRATKGSAFGFTASADVYCAAVESSESDNALYRTIRVGY